MLSCRFISSVKNSYVHGRVLGCSLLCSSENRWEVERNVLPHEATLSCFISQVHLKSMKKQRHARNVEVATKQLLRCSRGSWSSRKLCSGERKMLSMKRTRGKRRMLGAVRSSITFAFSLLSCRQNVLRLPLPLSWCDELLRLDAQAENRLCIASDQPLLKR